MLAAALITGVRRHIGFTSRVHGLPPPMTHHRDGDGCCVTTLAIRFID
jgi:hypothetical protein